MPESGVGGKAGGTDRASAEMASVRLATSRRTRAAVGLSAEAPQTVEDLRPWMAEVERAKGRGMDVREFRHIAKLVEPGAEWRWTVCCTTELLMVMADSLVAFPFRTSDARSSNGASNSAACANPESQGILHVSWLGDSARQG